MKAQQPTPILFFLLLAIALFGLAACSPSGDVPEPASSGSFEPQPLSPADNEESEAPGAPPPAMMTSANLPEPEVREGMLAFDGTIFVATTELVGELWQAAGWSIADTPFSADPADLPADCTLYPHEGVENQWVGRCRGYILVPEAGARDIAVMVTDESGSTTMVQVAPPPVEPGP